MRTPAARRRLLLWIAAAVLPLAHAARAADLPGTPEESPQFLEAKARFDAADARYKAAEAASAAAQQASRAAYAARDGAAELREIDLMLSRLGLEPGPHSRPPQENMAKIGPLLERRRALMDRVGRQEDPAARDATRAADAARADAQREWDEARTAVYRYKVSLEFIQEVRRARVPNTVAATARQIADAPDQYAGQWVRVLGATFVSRERDDRTPVTGQALSMKTGVLAPVTKPDGSQGSWNRLACLDADGTPLPEAYEQIYSSGNQGVTPGHTVDLYGRVVRMGETNRVVFLCDRVVPHGPWSVPPAPGFDAKAAGGDALTRPAAPSR